MYIFLWFSDVAPPPKKKGQGATRSVNLEKAIAENGGPLTVNIDSNLGQAIGKIF